MPAFQANAAMNQTRGGGGRLERGEVMPPPDVAGHPPGWSEASAEFVLEPGPGSRHRRSWLRALLQRVDEAAERADRSGQAVDLTIRIRPSAEPRVASAVHQDDALDEALRHARSRGAEQVARILKSPDMLTARAFGPLVGMSHETVNQKRKVGELLGLQGATRGYRFPRWQITDEGLPLPGLATLSEILGGGPWTLYRFLLSPHNELGGETAVEALKAGRLEAVTAVARNISLGVFA